MGISMELNFVISICMLHKCSCKYLDNFKLELSLLSRFSSSFQVNIAFTNKMYFNLSPFTLFFFLNKFNGHFEFLNLSLFGENFFKENSIVGF